jgi:hypothetical protein
MLRELFYVGPSLATLHEEYAKQGRIDPASPVRSSSSLVVDAAAEQVWEAISDLRSWPVWHPEIQVLDLAGVTPDARFTWKLGGAKIRATFALVEPERELTWTGLSYGFKAVDRHVLEPVDGGRTRVTIEESMAGPLLPLLYGPARLRRGHEKWLGALRAYVEGRN